MTVHKDDPAVAVAQRQAGLLAIFVRRAERQPGGALLLSAEGPGDGFGAHGATLRISRRAGHAATGLREKAERLRFQIHRGRTSHDF